MGRVQSIVIDFVVHSVLDAPSLVLKPAYVGCLIDGNLLTALYQGYSKKTYVLTKEMKAFSDFVLNSVLTFQNAL